MPFMSSYTLDKGSNYIDCSWNGENETALYQYRQWFVIYRALLRQIWLIKSFLVKTPSARTKVKLYCKSAMTKSQIVTREYD